MNKHIVIIGGGAAGFFAAINCAIKNPHYKITILEKSSTLLNKVKISGGGRCNVTHACFVPAELIKFYPRGHKQLLGPFTRFNPTNTVEWFNERGINLATEDDGRMFPASNSSQTIINCFLQEASRLNISIETHTSVENIETNSNKIAVYTRSHSNPIIADSIIITSGSSRHIWNILERAGHHIINPVPSLFTFNIKDSRIKGLEGLSVQNAAVSIKDLVEKNGTTGPLLVTHWGLSGPAILKLSAWQARTLAEKKYSFILEVNWINKPKQEVISELKKMRETHARKNTSAHAQFHLPKRLWERLTADYQNFGDISNKQIELLAQEIAEACFIVTGKSTYKDEFVTAGGVDLSEVDFKTMQSKKINGVYFAGEVLDIDALTGGFNFQAAWTTAWIAANAV